MQSGAKAGIMNICCDNRGKPQGRVTGDNGKNRMVSLSANPVCATVQWKAPASIHGTAIAPLGPDKKTETSPSTTMPPRKYPLFPAIPKEKPWKKNQSKWFEKKAYTEH